MSASFFAADLSHCHDERAELLPVQRHMVVEHVFSPFAVCGLSTRQQGGALNSVFSCPVAR